MYSGVSNDYWSYQNNPYQQNNQPYTGYPTKPVLAITFLQHAWELTPTRHSLLDGGSPVYSNTGYSLTLPLNLPYPPYAVALLPAFA